MNAPKTTKKARLLRLIDAYRAANKIEGPYSLNDASEWAINNGLYPVPTRTSSADECEVWERRFEQVTGAPAR